MEEKANDSAPCPDLEEKKENENQELELPGGHGTAQSLEDEENKEDQTLVLENLPGIQPYRSNLQSRNNDPLI